MVVNGACETDWPQVAELARRHPVVLPAFGAHPWHLGELTPHWQENLVRFLDQTPGAVIGEIGLDRWMLDNPGRWRSYRGPDDASHHTPCSVSPPSLAEQEAAFVWQLQLAAGRNVPASIHCLQAFGRLLELLRANPRLARGFLLHSYGGPAEMVPAFAKLGAYFSFPGYFAHPRKLRQRETFRAVPPERLLIETDAPDQLPPEDLIRFPLTEPGNGRGLNHPANLPAIYGFLAEFLGESTESLATRVAGNFARLFETG